MRAGAALVVLAVMVFPYSALAGPRENEYRNLRELDKAVGQLEADVRKHKAEIATLNKAEAPIGTPRGAICALYGDPASVPEGWLVCDGSSVDYDTYRGLADLLVGLSRTQVVNGRFDLPDLRGYFLRGLDWVKSGEDPKTRVDPGYADRSVGHAQLDTFKKHTHPVKAWVGRADDPNTGNEIEVADKRQRKSSFLPTEPSGDDETRPKNISVLWIIKT